MTGISFAVDCASFQGSPDWARVSAVCAGGAEKVTEGTSYTNPRWAASKPGMLAMAVHGFVPLAYMFLDAAEPGAAQAQYFARQAGNLDGFGIVIDFERAPNGSPTLAQAQDAAAELRRLYPGHPVGGYAPHWYTGGENLSFCDWLWASEYVNGSGDPGILYGRVPASWWDAYGGKSPLMLQFTDSATVAGISGPVDCSAFRGDAGELAARVLPAPPVASTVKSGDGMLILLPARSVPVTFPVWAYASEYKEPAAYGNCSLVLAGETGTVVQAVLFQDTREIQRVTATLTEGRPFAVVPAKGWGPVSVVTLSRLDTKTALAASAAFRTW